MTTSSVQSQRQTYLDDPDSRSWLLDVHCIDLSDWQKDLVSKSVSAFILYGNEDFPDRIEIYGTNTPMNGEIPLFVLERDDDGDLVVTPPIPSGSKRPFYISPSTIGY